MFVIEKDPKIELKVTISMPTANGGKTESDFVGIFRLISQEDYSDYLEMGTEGENVMLEEVLIGARGIEAGGVELPEDEAAKAVTGHMLASAAAIGAYVRMRSGQYTPKSKKSARRG